MHRIRDFEKSRCKSKKGQPKKEDNAVLKTIEQVKEILVKNGTDLVGYTISTLAVFLQQKFIQHYSFLFLLCCTDTVVVFAFIIHRVWLWLNNDFRYNCPARLRVIFICILHHHQFIYKILTLQTLCLCGKKNSK